MLENLTLRPQPVGSGLDVALDAFLLDREAGRCTPKTIQHYQYTVGGFIAFCKQSGIMDVIGVRPATIRAYLVGLQRRGLKDTTQHAHARGIKAWLRWCVAEGLIERSPMERVSMPRLEQRIPAPFAPDDVKALLAGCDRHTAMGARDMALILCLLDTGLRAAELCTLRLGDVNMRTGLATVIGKGQKQRTVRAGSRARKAILYMLDGREDQQVGAPLWLAYDRFGQVRGALSVGGLQTILWRLGQRTGVTPCGAHRFRRTFALWCLRDGMDLHSLRLLMGHSSLAVLQRYLAIAGEDLERAHKAHSPVDRLLG